MTTHHSEQSPPSLKGSCHCGKVTFEITGEPDAALACNCLLCFRKGALLWAVSRDEFHVLSGSEALGTYTCNAHRILHCFCSTCGIHPYSEGVDPNGNPLTVINLRCLDGIDPEALPVHHFDGPAL